MDTTITVPNSVFIDNQWHEATWLAEIVDDDTGELIITATINQPTRVVALSMNMDLARRLRAMAMQQTPKPYDCRTTEERLAVQEDRLQILSDTMRRIVALLDQRLDALEDGLRVEEQSTMAALVSIVKREDVLEQRLDALERNQRVDHRTMHETFNQHQARVDGHAEQLGTQARQAAALETKQTLCPRCEGVGTVYLDGEDTACPDCDGYGKLRAAGDA